MKFSLFSFFRFECLFFSEFSTMGMELYSNASLWLIPPSRGNNSISTKWALYLWNATYRHCHEKTSYVSNFALSFYWMNGSIEGRCTNHKNSSVCNSDFIARSVLLEFFKVMHFALYRLIYAVKCKTHNLTLVMGLLVH